MHRDMVVSYTRDLLEQITGGRPEPDNDGDLPIEYGGASFYVRIDGPTDPVVQIFSVVLADLEPNPELHGALNEINSRLRFARAFHVQQQVLIEAEIWGSDLNMSNFQHACRNVAMASDAHGNALLNSFGGTPRFEMSKKQTYRVGFIQD
jgi:Putative bacterial sensory transduction regulator